MNEHYFSKLKHIKAFVFDVDGVFTDNSLISNEVGELWRVFHARDGFALKTAIEKNYTICVITGGFSQSVRKRFEQFGIRFIYEKVNHKKEKLQHFFEQSHILPEETLYIGDDIPDYEPMLMCGIKCAPNDAVPEITGIADYVCQQKGGNGCVREVIEMVLKSQDNWFSL